MTIFRTILTRHGNRKFFLVGIKWKYVTQIFLLSMCKMLSLTCTLLTSRRSSRNLYNIDCYGRSDTNNDRPLTIWVILYSNGWTLTHFYMNWFIVNITFFTTNRVINICMCMCINWYLSPSPSRPRLLPSHPTSLLLPDHGPWTTRTSCQRWINAMPSSYLYICVWGHFCFNVKLEQIYYWF